MVMVASNQLYEDVVEATRGYLGPAADRFIARQITNHLHKKPEELSAADMGKLIDWLKLSMAFLTDDEQLITSYVEELRRITRNRSSIKERRSADGSQTRHN